LSLWWLLAFLNPFAVCVERIAFYKSFREPRSLPTSHYCQEFRKKKRHRPRFFSAVTAIGLNERKNMPFSTLQSVYWRLRGVMRRSEGRGARYLSDFGSMSAIGCRFGQGGLLFIPTPSSRQVYGRTRAGGKRCKRYTCSERDETGEYSIGWMVWRLRSWPCTSSTETRGENKNKTQVPKSQKSCNSGIKMGRKRPKIRGKSG